ncbi:VanW family protein [Christensenellaceae bacterium OttesenSCG-928-M15]|nr:VanW family protein [Christensenellaceae bacterium OttesenSCG-928-M15]
MEQRRPGSSRTNAGKGPELPQYIQRSGSTRSYAGTSSPSRGPRPSSAGNGGTRALSTRSTTAQKPTTRAGNGGGGHGSNGGNGHKRKKKTSRSQRLMQIAIGLFAGLLLIVGSILLLRQANEPGPDATLADFEEHGEKFDDGVMIAGVNVGGLELDEARSKVEQAISTELGTVSLTLSHDGASWTFTSNDLGMATNVDDLLLDAMKQSKTKPSESDASKLSFTGGGASGYQPDYSVRLDKVVSKLNEIAGEVNRAPVEPHLIPSLSSDFVQSFETVQGEKGYTLDVDATAALIEECIKNRNFTGSVSPVLAETESAQSIEFLKENTKRIASFTTKYKQSTSDETVKGRVFNIQKTVDIINEHVVQPGETFSFNGLCGIRNEANGWKQANGISGGKEYTLQYGGGICQVSTTLYGAVLRGNIKIPENGRRKHSIPSSYVPYGLDATVDSSGIDFQFTNDTGAPVYIFAYTKEIDKRNREVTVSLYGKPLPEGVTYSPRSEVIDTKENDTPKYVDDATVPLGYDLKIIEARPAYTAEVYLQQLVDGKVVDETLLYKETYRGNNAEYRRGTGDPATTKVPVGAELRPGYSPAATDPGSNNTAQQVQDNTPPQQDGGSSSPEMDIPIVEDENAQ